MEHGNSISGILGEKKLITSYREVDKFN